MRYIKYQKHNLIKLEDQFHSDEYCWRAYMLVPTEGAMDFWYILNQCKLVNQQFNYFFSIFKNVSK